MLASLAIAGFLVQGNTLVFTLLAGALAPLFLIRVIPREFAWASFAVMVNLALAACALRLTDHVGSRVLLSGYYTAAVALLWSVCAIGLVRRGHAAVWHGFATRAPVADGCHVACGASLNRACLSSVSHIAATTAGLTSAVIVIFMVCIRSVYSILEISHGAPLWQNQAFKFGVDGMMIIAALILSCLMNLWATRDRRLYAALFWLFVLAWFWGALLVPVYRQFPGGGFERAAGPLMLSVGLAVTLCGFVTCQSLAKRRARWRAIHDNPGALLAEFAYIPGLRANAGAAGIILILALCYQMADPSTMATVGPRLAAVTAAVCGCASGVAVFSLVSCRWSANLSDVAMGLVTIGVVVFALVFVPSEPVELGARFPMIFNAMMFALAGMTFFWVWIGKVWRQQLDGGRAWTTAGRLAPLCQRFAFFVACMGLVMGTLMAVWPRLRPVGILDDSLGRVGAAVAAHLLLMLVLLWSRRTTGRSSFGAMTILVIVSMMMYIVVRSGPLSSRVLPGGSVHRLKTGATPHTVPKVATPA